MINFPGKRPSNLGVQGGQLAACPSSPNCVCSQASPEERCHVAPIQFQNEPGMAMETLVDIISSLPGVSVVAREEGYIHAECRTRLLGFVDDLEVLCDPQTKVFHVRSASRVGYGDLGVNRRRVEKIRRLFEESVAGSC